MAKYAFTFNGQIEIDDDHLGITVANGITSDDSLESKEGIMGVRLEPNKALSVWLQSTLLREFYKEFAAGDPENTRMLVSPPVIRGVG
jgi:hypothetical protein